DDPVRAWYLPLTGGDDEKILDEWKGNPEHILSLFARAEPLRDDSPRPVERTIEVWAEAPGWVIVSQLHDPQWKAHWIGMEGQGEFDAPIRPTFRRWDDVHRRDEPGAWQRVDVPGEGFWLLHLEYEPRDAAEGAAISTIAWCAWWTAAFSLALRA